MRFYELHDNVGIAFYRWDDENLLLYFWNEVNATWEPSIWHTLEELEEYGCGHDCTIIEVTEDDVR